MYVNIQETAEILFDTCITDENASPELSLNISVSAHCSAAPGRMVNSGLAPLFRADIRPESQALLWWDSLQGGSKLMADCLDFDENFELGKI